jgi:anti-sigma regulatory factor (Ser/Thr protein kinase)
MHVARHFESDVGSANLARRFVEATLAAWDLDDLNDVACLLTSELASNAIRHAGTAFWITMDFDQSELRVEVADLAPLLPVLGKVRNDLRSGRGLLIVEALASRWGIVIRDEVKAVWFCLIIGRPQPSIS